MKMFRTFAVPVLVAALAMSVSAIGASAAAGPLVVTKTVNTTTALPGGSLTYNISVRNSGDATAENVTLSDTLNGNLAFGSAGSFTPTVTAGANGTSTLQFNLGSIAPGATVTVPVTVNASAGITAETVINNTATAGGSNVGTATSNTVGVTVGPNSPSIIISKVPNSPTATAGTTLTYNITVRNIGGSMATGVTVRDILDPATTLVSVTPTPNTSANGTLSFSVGNLAPQQSFTFTAQARINDGTAVGTAIDNTIEVSGNNFATVTAPSAVSVVAGGASPTPSLSPSASPTPSATVTATPTVTTTPSPSQAPLGVIFDPDTLPETGIGEVLVIALAVLLILSLWPILSARTRQHIG